MFRDLLHDKDLLNQTIGIVIFSHNELLDPQDRDFAIKVAQKAKIIITSDQYSAKKVYADLNEISEKSKLSMDPLNEKPIFIIKKGDLEDILDRVMGGQSEHFENKQD